MRSDGIHTLGGLTVHRGFLSDLLAISSSRITSSVFFMKSK
jgi:hypothetical protein